MTVSAGSSPFGGTSDPERVPRPLVDPRRFAPVSGSPTCALPADGVFPQDRESEVLADVVEGLRFLPAAEHQVIEARGQGASSQPGSGQWRGHRLGEPARRRGLRLLPGCEAGG